MASVSAIDAKKRWLNSIKAGFFLDGDELGGKVRSYPSPPHGV